MLTWVHVCLLTHGILQVNAFFHNQSQVSTKHFILWKESKGSEASDQSLSFGFRKFMCPYLTCCLQTFYDCCSFNPTAKQVPAMFRHSLGQSCCNWSNMESLQATQTWLVAEVKIPVLKLLRPSLHISDVNCFTFIDSTNFRHGL